jgi:nucleotide-binding universal stress UspA family protein
MSEILIGYDGSRAAKSALEHGLEFAKNLGDTVLVVFGYAPGGYGGGEVPAQRAAVQEFGEKVTKEAAATAKNAKVKCEVLLVNKHPDEALIDTAEERKARMIVVGSHGESPLKGAIIGSTPLKLVQRSDTPVLVVRA